MDNPSLARAQSVFARFPAPPCSQTLGWTLLDADPDAGTVTVAFEGRREFCNPAGTIQGGFLAAMLDDVMGPAVLVQSDGQYFTPTIEMKVSFVAPAPVGRLTAIGRVVHRGGTVAFLEGELFDADGRLLAKASASARLVPTDRLQGTRPNYPRD